MKNALGNVDTVLLFGGRSEIGLAIVSELVGAGATWGEVNTATQRQGLIVAGLAVPGIGVAGSTLGGGHGMLRRTYGLACDNIASAPRPLHSPAILVIAIAFLR